MDKGNSSIIIKCRNHLQEIFINIVEIEKKYQHSLIKTI